MSPSVVNGSWGSSVHVVTLSGEVLMVAVGLIEVDCFTQLHVIDCGLWQFFRLFPGAHARVSARLRGLVIEYRVVLRAGVIFVGDGGSGMRAHRLRGVDLDGVGAVDGYGAKPVVIIDGGSGGREVGCCCECVDVSEIDVGVIDLDVGEVGGGVGVEIKGRHGGVGSGGGAVLCSAEW